jgi:hypothetical protein
MMAHALSMRVFALIDLTDSCSAPTHEHGCSTSIGLLQRLPERVRELVGGTHVDVIQWEHRWGWQDLTRPSSPFV